MAGRGGGNISLLAQKQLAFIKRSEALDAKAPKPSRLSSHLAESSSTTVGATPAINRNTLRQQFDTIQYLLNNRGPKTIDEIFENTQINLRDASCKGLFELLGKNPLIAFDPINATFAYQPHVNIHSLDELLDEVNKYPEQGLNSELVLDSYKGIDADIKRLIEEKRVLAVRPKGGKSPWPILFPVVEVTPSLSAITTETKEIWNAIEMPDDLEIERELEKIGQSKPVVTKRASESGEGGPGKKKSKRGRKPASITNTHLPPPSS